MDLNFFIIGSSILSLVAWIQISENSLNQEQKPRDGRLDFHDFFKVVAEASHPEK